MPEAAPSFPGMCGEGYVARLRRKGFQIIGTGGGWSFDTTFVLAKPGADTVIKVGTFPAGDPWPLYAAWCLTNPGPLRPVVRALRWHGTGASRFFVAMMDRLDAVDWHQSGPLLAALHDWYELTISLGIDRREWYDEPMDRRIVAALAARLDMAGLPEAATFIRTTTAAFPSYRWDPQPENWMVSPEGRLVMVDPFFRIRGEVPETAPRLRGTFGGHIGGPVGGHRRSLAR